MDKNELKFTTEIKINGELFIKTKLNMKSIEKLAKIVERLEGGKEVK